MKTLGKSWQLLAPLQQEQSRQPEAEEKHGRRLWRPHDEFLRRGVLARCATAGYRKRGIRTVDRKLGEKVSDLRRRKRRNISLRSRQITLRQTAVGRIGIRQIGDGLGIEHAPGRELKLTRLS
jgi:hypothetical protein